MKEVARTPTLEAATSTGRAKFWLCRILTADDLTFFLQSESWQKNDEGQESKHVLSTPAQVEPKNVGKRNETGPFEQARLEMVSKQERQIDKGYNLKGVVAAERTFTLPMLAHTLEKKKHRVQFPVYVQPKYNGIRCLYNSSIGFWSRQGKELLIDVTEHLATDTKGETIDGELLLPPAYTFQQTISAIKKYDAKLSPKLLYRVYDVVQPLVPFRTRWVFLHDLVARHKDFPFNGWLLAETQVASTERQLNELHLRFVREGFEGSIIRDPDGLYSVGHRSNALLKHKDFVDAEFEIVGFEEGIGKDKGAIIFQCVTAKGKTFNARPEGTMDERYRMFKIGRSYVGKKLTVRYQTLTDDGVPLFPVGVTVRDYEE